MYMIIEAIISIWTSPDKILRRGQPYIHTQHTIGHRYDVITSLRIGIPDPSIHVRPRSSRPFRLSVFVARRRRRQHGVRATLFPSCPSTSVPSVPSVHARHVRLVHPRSSGPSRLLSTSVSFVPSAHGKSKKV